MMIKSEQVKLCNISVRECKGVGEGVGVGENVRVGGCVSEWVSEKTSERMYITMWDIEKQGVRQLKRWVVLLIDILQSSNHNQ